MQTAGVRCGCGDGRRLNAARASQTSFEDWEGKSLKGNLESSKRISTSKITPHGRERVPPSVSQSTGQSVGGDIGRERLDAWKPFSW